jgi:hypothetical protein
VAVDGGVHVGESLASSRKGTTATDTIAAGRTPSTPPLASVRSSVDDAVAADSAGVR